MKQKRYGKNELLNALRNRHKLVYNEWFTLNSGYKVVNDSDDIVGFITYDLFYKLLSNKEIKMCGGGYYHTTYTINEYQI